MPLSSFFLSLFFILAACEMKPVHHQWRSQRGLFLKGDKDKEEILMKRSQVLGGLYKRDHYKFTKQIKIKFKIKSIVVNFKKILKYFATLTLIKPLSL